MSSILRIDKLTHRTKGRTLLAIDYLELTTGKFYGVLGPNGAGKSTLLKTISGDQQSRAQVGFHGAPLRTLGHQERAKHIGVLPQSNHLSFPFTAREVVALGLTSLTLSRAQAEQHIDEVMRTTDSLHLASKNFPLLSGGEKQRVHLARVLLQLCQADRSPLLLLDEPTSAQDLGQQHAMLSLIHNLCAQRGFTCLAVLHDLNHALAYCDDCIVIDQGKIRCQGPSKEVLSTELIGSCWGYTPEYVTLPDSGRSAFI